MAATPIRSKKRISLNLVGIGSAVVVVLCSLAVVLNTMPNADTTDFAERLGLTGGWSEEKELRFQQLDTCSDRVMCLMSYADQKEYELLKEHRPDHMEYRMSGGFGEIPNYFSLSDSGDS